MRLLNILLILFLLFIASCDQDTVNKPSESHQATLLESTVATVEKKVEETPAPSDDPPTPRPKPTPEPLVPLSVSGVVSGEAPLAGVSIHLIDSKATRVTLGQTDVSGNYHFRIEDIDLVFPVKISAISENQIFSSIILEASEEPLVKHLNAVTHVVSQNLLSLRPLHLLDSELLSQKAQQLMASLFDGALSYASFNSDTNFTPAGLASVAPSMAGVLLKAMHFHFDQQSINLQQYVNASSTSDTRSFRTGEGLVDQETFQVALAWAFVTEGFSNDQIGSMVFRLSSSEDVVNETVVLSDGFGKIQDRLPPQRFSNEEQAQILRSLGVTLIQSILQEASYQSSNTDDLLEPVSYNILSIAADPMINLIQQLQTEPEETSNEAFEHFIEEAVFILGHLRIAEGNFPDSIVVEAQTVLQSIFDKTLSIIQQNLDQTDIRIARESIRTKDRTLITNSTLLPVLKEEPQQPLHRLQEQALFSDPPNVVIEAVPSTVVTGGLVRLDGSLTTDPEDDELSYEWSLIAIPLDSLAFIDDKSEISTQFIPDAPGSYTVKLTVQDGKNEASSTVVVIANGTPEAHAGSDLTVGKNINISLSGNLSSDFENTPLSYHWRIIETPAGASPILMNDHTVSPIFRSEAPGSYIILLEVNDGKSSSTDTMEVLVSDAPTIATTSELMVARGTQVTLSALESSDPEGEVLNYSWEFISKPHQSSAVIAGQETPDIQFTADLNGLYWLRLSVSDGYNIAVQDSFVTVNHAPIIIISQQGSMNLGETFTLEPSQISDHEDDALSYLWELTSSPESNTASIENSRDSKARFTPTAGGNYTIQLSVDDGFSTAIKEISLFVNQLPILDIVGSHAMSEGESLALSIISSDDLDGDELSYLWEIITAPSGSDAVLENPQTVTPTFQPDKHGAYQLRLTAYDGLGEAAALVSVVVDGIPEADAGADQTIALGDNAELTAEGSSDPENQILTYEWSLLQRPIGSSIDIEASTEAVAFTPDVRGNYSIWLTVTDTEGNEDSTLVTITANQPPTADAGSTQNVAVNTSVTLDGRGSSDVDSDIGYFWELVSGPSTPSFDSTASHFDITLDDLGTYEFQLTVSDGISGDQDTVSISTSSIPVANIAVPAEGIEFGVGGVYTLDATGSINLELEEELSFSWNTLQQPVGSNLSFTPLVESGAQVDFTADQAGAYEVEVTVFDGFSNGTTTVELYVNEAPEANAGEDQTIALTDSVSISAHLSEDLEGDDLDYSWEISSQPDGSTLSLASSDTVEITVTPDIRGDYEFQVTVSDDYSSHTDIVTVTANAAPVANAGSDDTIGMVEIVLSGAASFDPEEDTLSYSWTVLSGELEDYLLTDENTVSPRFTPLVTGTFEIQLTVNDAYSSSSHSIFITANGVPIAEAGDNQSMIPGDSVTLDASGSTDPEDDSLSYKWQDAEGSVLAETESFEFTVLDTGLYTLYLTATDPEGNQSSDSVMVTVNTPPSVVLGQPQITWINTLVPLDASASSDLDDHELSYFWNISSAPEMSNPILTPLDEAHSLHVFTTDTSGQYEINVEVNDGFESHNNHVDVIVNGPKEWAIPSILMQSF